MERFFNTAGPIMPEDHYNIAPLSRLDLEEILFMIKQKKHFVLHAPRQTGKTSFLRALMAYLNKDGQYLCLHINVENAQTAREDVKAGIRSIINTLAERALDSLDDSFLIERWQQILDESGEHNALQNALKLWSQNCNRPIVLLIDEIDSLVGDTLISVLRQLRSGYESRPSLFPQSIVLCGVRDVKDYRIHSSSEKEMITGGSAFNVKAVSLRLGNFCPEEVKELFLQHTGETGQVFDDDIFPLIWELTEGQPWLVNALGYEVCFNMKENRDRTRNISSRHIQQAKENLILRRETHLDQLAHKLKEDRVRRVLEPILSEEEAQNFPVDDLDYAMDLGLVVKEKNLRIANPIYREFILQELKPKNVEKQTAT